MKFAEVQKRIRKILKDGRSFTTAEIAKLLGYDSPTWPHYVLTCMQGYGDVMNVSETRRKLWRKAYYGNT